MPIKKPTRLAQMLATEQKRRELNDREAAGMIGASQQAFSTWKRGSVPRAPMRAALARWLRISPDMMDELCDEAVESKGSTKLPALATARLYGKVSDRKTGMFKFDPVNAGRKAIPEGRYSVVVDTKIMEPALRVGCTVWLDPAIWPAPSHEVIAHSEGGRAWIGVLEGLADGTASLTRPNGEPIIVQGVRAVHVIVMAARVVDAA